MSAVSRPVSISGNSKVVLLLGSVMIAALVFDVLAAWFFDTLEDQLVSPAGTLTFVVVTIVMYGASLRLLLGATRRITRDVRSRVLYPSIMYWATTMVQCIMTVIFAIIILEMTLGEHYSVLWIIAVIMLSSALAAFILGMQAYRFISWFATSTDRRKDAMILLYGLAPALAALAIGVSVFTHTSIVLQDKPPVIEPEQQISFQSVGSGTHGLAGTLFIYAYAIPLSLAFVCIMTGSALHLRQHVQTGRTKYWALVCIPPASLLGGLVSTYAALPGGSFNLYLEELIVFRVVNLTGALVSFGIIGLSYWTMAKSVRQVNAGFVHDYLVMAAVGIVAQAISLMPPVYHAPYPPFGVPSHSFIASMSFIGTMGIYSSALSISGDAKLRKSIRKFAEEARLLDKIGTAQMRQELQGRVMTLAKEHSDRMAKETGVQPSLTEEDVKCYLEEIVKELKKS